MDPILSRRTFLKASGLTIALSITPLGFEIINASEKKEGFKPNVWFEITPDNKVTITIGASEMGQGSHTGLAMIIADELEADWKQVRIRQAPGEAPYNNPILGAQITVASASIRGFFEPLRKAGATGRVMLIKAAAETWKVPEEECEAFNSTIKHKKTGKVLTYGKICQKAATLPIPENPPLKNETQFRYIGKNIARVDIPDKVEGKAIFGLDLKIPDMLYGVLARPPAYNAKPLTFDEQAAMSIKGVKKVVQTPRGIAVVADTLEAAWKGREALKVNWDRGSHPQMDNEFIEKYFMECLDRPGAVAKKVGDAKKALEEAPKKYEAIYYVPHIAHALMEPINCTAYVQDDRCDIWAPTQSQTGTKMIASKLSGLPPEKVHVHTTYLGCGLGRRAQIDFVSEAVIVSKALGRPVKIVWTREEDLKYDLFRAATCQRIKAGLDNQGHVIAWDHKVVCTSILKTTNPAMIKDGVDIYCLWGIIDTPKPPVLSHTVYEFPNFYVEQFLSELPIPACPWRSVQNAPNAFIMECFMDELAHLTGKDPVEFRMHLLKNNIRARRVLEAVAEKAGWGKPIPKGNGRGIAQHSCFGSYVAQVVDLTVDKNNGSIKVERVVCAVDCGLAILPDAVIAQIQGSIILGISTALKEEILFENGGVRSENFNDYKLIKMSEVPEIEVYIIPSKEKIGGIGEPGVTPVAPAIANAVFNATGARIRRLPLTPKTVLSAIKK